MDFARVAVVNEAAPLVIFPRRTESVRRSDCTSIVRGRGPGRDTRSREAGFAVSGDIVSSHSRRVPERVRISGARHFSVAVRIHGHRPAVGNEIGRIHALEHRATRHAIAGLQRLPTIHLRFAGAAPPRNISRPDASVRGIGALKRLRRRAAPSASLSSREHAASRGKCRRREPRRALTMRAESADFNSEALRRAGSGHGTVTECPLLPATSNSIA